MKTRIQGTITEIGDTGSLITDIPNEQVAEAPRDENFAIKFGGHETIGLYESDHDQPASTMVATLGESGFLEIEIVGISLAEMLGIKAGDEVSAGW